MLEDEFNEVRKTCLQALILFKKYIKPEDLKVILIYMLNDEHEVVREETLISSLHLRNQELVREDLETILMCLREKRANMRKYVYKTLAIVLLKDPNLLLLIIDKAVLTLQVYKSDKKHIYRMLKSLGQKYQPSIPGLLEKLAVLDSNEANWKNVIYKAKMVFCFEWWSQLGS